MLFFFRNIFLVLTISEPHSASFVRLTPTNKLPSSKYYSRVPHSSNIGPATYAMTRGLPWRLVAVIQTELNWKGCT